MKKTDTIHERILPRAEVKAQSIRWGLKSKSIAFTNGVFDILHEGHLALLSKAASFADILIVGVNSDASVKRLKGESRPINNQQSRAMVLASLLMVDAVVIFEEDTPLELIMEIEPEVLIKGGDYTLESTLNCKLKIISNNEQGMMNAEVLKRNPDHCC